MKLTRRQFARQIVGASAAGLGGLLPLAALTPVPRSIVAVSSSQALKRKHDDIDRNGARTFLDAALPALTGAGDPISAWKSLFRPGERVAIKLSCVPGLRLSSSRGLVAAIVDGLTAAGVAPSRIVVWDRTTRELERAGFGKELAGARVAATDSYPGWGYSDQVETCGSIGSCFSLIMLEADALISVPVLKDHDLTGISNGLKNFYGAIHNPNKYHGNNGDPFIADLCTHPLIRGKLRLTISDASRVVVQGGPAFSPSHVVEYGGLLASRDMVAIDACGWEIVEELRSVQKLPALKEEGRAPLYLKTAAARGLGVADRNQIKIVNT